MTMYKITAPVAGFTGKSAGINFVDGFADLDGDTDGRALAFFRRRGYGIAVVDGKDTDVKQDVTAPANAGPFELRGDSDDEPRSAAEAARQSKEVADREAAQEGEPAASGRSPRTATPVAETPRTGATSRRAGSKEDGK